MDIAGVCMDWIPGPAERILALVKTVTAAGFV
jgi:hypothetical protein